MTDASTPVAIDWIFNKAISLEEKKIVIPESYVHRITRCCIAASYTREHYDSYRFLEKAVWSNRRMADSKDVQQSATETADCFTRKHWPLLLPKRHQRIATVH